MQQKKKKKKKKIIHLLSLQFENDWMLFLTKLLQQYHYTLKQTRKIIMLTTYKK